RQGWGMTVAGSSVRYRRRIRMMQRIEMRTRVIGWDARFFYIEQSIWREGEALNNVLIRSAVTDAKGIVAPERLVAAMGHEGTESPALAAWVQAWIAADAQRPWPPARG
ncbi:MAG: thioesterase family protein, partial [Rhodobacteraceae bacterium]|nr:thioesterase family protein [Paracoccaceae bacterium]